MPDAESYRVIVIGAGVSGLSCAFRLHQAGVKVGVLEPLPRVGGSIQTIQQDGFLLELGPNSFSSKPEIDSLVADVGLAEDYLQTPLRCHPRFVFDGKQLREVPTGLVSFLATPLLSWRAKLGVLAEPFLVRRPAENVSVAEFVREHLGQEALEMLVAPFVSGIYAGDPERMSMRAAFPLIFSFAQARGSVVRGAFAHLGEKRRARKAGGKARTPRRPSSLCSFREGMIQLPQRLMQKLDGHVQLGVAIERVHINERGAYRLIVRRNGECRTLRADVLVVATTASVAAQVCRDWIPAAGVVLGEVAYMPLVVVHVGAPLGSLQRQPNGFGFLVPRGRGVRLLGTLWTSAVFPRRAPAGQTLLTVFYGGATDPEIVHWDDNALRHQVEKDLHATMGWDGCCDMFRVTRYDGALPAYALDHPARLMRLEQVAASSPAPVRFLGNYKQGISLPDCVRQADAVAAELVVMLRDTQPQESFRA